MTNPSEITGPWRELATLSDEVELTPTTAKFPDNWSFEQWSEYGKTLSRLSGGIMWWIGDWWRYGERKYGERAAQALDPEGYAYQTLKDAGWVAGKIERSRRRDLSWSHHKEVAALEPEQQDALLDAAKTEGWSKRDLRSAARDTKRQARVEQIVRNQEPSFDQLGPYAVLLADPPWRYDFALDSDTRAIENQYPTMTVEEIAALAIPAADDAVLFLWVTSPKLPEGLTVLESWGFTYKTCAVWDKGKIGMGYYFRQQHELLFVATRGSLPVPAASDRPSSVIRSDRGEHSVKPVEVYELIEAMYPDYLAPGIETPGDEMLCELFQRQPRDGWAGWGNEVQ